MPGHNCDAQQTGKGTESKKDARFGILFIISPEMYG